MNPIPINHSSQRGIVLIISLLMLLLLTLIGVTAMQTTALQEKMAGNMRNKHLAFQAAEAALRGGEDWLVQQIKPPQPCDTAPCNVWQLNALNGGDFLSATPWSSGKAQTYSNTTLTNAVNTPPQYFIEYYAFIKDSLVMGKQNDATGRNIYRITARGTGGTDTAQAVLQTTYTRRF